MLSEQQLDARKPGKTERLLKITAALLFSKRGLSREELLAAIPEYNSGGRIDPDSALRKFEHDKSDLREIGIKIETVISEEIDETRYVIAANNFSWPKDTILTAHQLQLLDLAAAAWSQASLAQEVDLALTKLRALGVTPAEADLIGVAPVIRTWDPAFAPLLEAIDEAQAVEFEYQKPSAEVSTRTVEPWLLKNIGGNWLLVSFDRHEGQVRNFLLKRIRSKVRFLGSATKPEKFARPTKERVAEALADLERHTIQQNATLRVRKDSAAWFAWGIESNDDWEETSVSYMDASLFAQQLIGFLPDVEILAPESLKTLVSQFLEQVYNDHV